MAAFRLDGRLAPRVLGGAIVGALFLKDVRQELALRLRPGDILVMDNRATHTVSGVAEAVRARDAGRVCRPAHPPGVSSRSSRFSPRSRTRSGGNSGP